MFVAVPHFTAFQTVLVRGGTDPSDRRRGFARPEFQGKRRSGLKVMRRLITPDGLYRHPILQIVHQAQFAGLRIVPDRQAQRFTRRDLAHPGRVPMCKASRAADRQLRIVPDFDGDRVHTVGSLLDVGIRNVFFLFGRLTGRTGKSRDNNENRHRAARNSIEAKETK